MYKSFTEIYQEQRMPLDYKIESAKEAIQKGFDVSKHTCALAFSGGQYGALAPNPLQPSPSGRGSLLALLSAGNMDGRGYLGIHSKI